MLCEQRKASESREQKVADEEVKGGAAGGELRVRALFARKEQSLLLQNRRRKTDTALENTNRESAQHTCFPPLSSFLEYKNIHIKIVFLNRKLMSPNKNLEN